MLINVDISPEELEEIDEDCFSNLFSEVARCSHYGFHRVVMSRPLARWVCNNVRLSETYLNQIELIRENNSENGELPEHAKCSLTIDFDKRLGIRGERPHWFVGYRNFNEGMKLDQTILLSKNSVLDGKFYKLLFDTEAQYRNIGQINFFPFHGDGADITKIFESLITSKNIVLCIVETDYSIKLARI